LQTDAETLGVEIRAGIHTGECELLDNDIAGVAVHIAARILGHAAIFGPGTAFPPPDAPPGYLTHITIEKVAGVGP
jgi:hypothetical protein